MAKPAPISLAILGTRGIPASYGGFETFAEELSTRLAARGHRVSVYCRRGRCGKDERSGDYRGVRRIWAWTLRTKYLETPIHGLMSVADAIFRRFDAVLVCNAANSPFIWPLRLLGVPVVVNVDGIERKRAKWSAAGRLWYRLGELCSIFFASKIVADADVIAQYYRQNYRVEPAVIRYGAQAQAHLPGRMLEKFALKPGGYLLYVSRLEPENNALGVIKAYHGLKTEMPLVIVGDAPYGQRYIEELRNLADERVVFTGFQFGEAYRELRTNCYLYIQATEVGGTHPALVEAMAYGNCVVANRVPEHEEVLGECGVYYARNDFENLRARLAELLDNPDLVRLTGQKARALAHEKFSWDGIVGEYEKLFAELY